MIDVTHDYIEGIGNEVFFSFISIVILVTTIAYFSYNYISRYSNVSQLSASDIDTSTMRSSVRYTTDNNCPICLFEITLPVETNCGHLFCAICLINNWRSGNWGGSMRCPICRQQVTLMLRCFNAASCEGDTTEIVESRSRCLRDINEYNRRFGGEPRPWLDYIWDLPTLLRHVTSEFFSVGGLMYMFRLRIVLCFVAALMYLISPLDMIPEAVFGLLGLLDDMFVVLLLAIYVTIIYRRFLAARWQDDDPNS